METVIAPDTSPRVRLLAVLAADAVGYSRLMSLDDQGTVAVALDAARAVFRDAIAAHAGRVIDMAGDSVLAVFENATAAVQAALTIQRQLNEGTASEVHEDRRMRFRIGVHLGRCNRKGRWQRVWGWRKHRCAPGKPGRTWRSGGIRAVAQHGQGSA